MDAKTRMRNILAVSLLAAFAVSWGLAPQAYAKHGHHGYYKEYKHKKDGLEWKFYKKVHFLKEHQEEIGLSDNQVDTLRDLKSNVKKDLIDSEAVIEKLKIDIDSLLRERKVDTEALTPLIDQKYEAKKARAKRLVEAYAQVKDLLSDQQYENMKKVWKEKDRDRD